MSTWYEVLRWKDGIEPVEIVRDTKDFVYLKSGRRGLKANTYFPTFDKAKQHMLDRSLDEIASLEDRLSRERARFVRIASLTEVEHEG